jgi:hypothetical protein
MFISIQKFFLLGFNGSLVLGTEQKVKYIFYMESILYLNFYKNMTSPKFTHFSKTYYHTKFQEHIKWH